MSDRDWASIREFREFARQEQENQRLADDRAQYEQQYLKTVEESQRRVPLVAPIPFEEWRAYTDPGISDPILRGAQATNAALLAIVRRDEAAELEAEHQSARDAILAGQPDKHWKIPASAAGLRMSVEKAEAFVREQSKLFVEHNREYFPNRVNFDAITEYLIAQGVTIPTEHCFRRAWLRLRELNIIEESPAPAPELQKQELEPSEPKLEDDPVDGFDIETGQPRKYTQREVWRMDSNTYKKAFKAWGENRPRFTRGYFGPR